MADYHPNADSRRNDLVDDVADRFDSQLLGDIVRDKLHYGENSILWLADAIETCYGLEEDSRLLSEEAQQAAFSAAEELREAEEAEVEARVMATLKVVVDDREEIEGFHGDHIEAVDEAERIVEAGELPEVDQGEEVFPDA